MKDVRTPDTYFNDPASTQSSVSKLKGKLNELLESLYQYKERIATTVAEEAILNDEIQKAEAMRYQKVSRDNALKVADAFVSGTPDDVAEAVWEAMSFKVGFRAQPSFMQKAEEIENQVFQAPINNSI